MIALVVPPDPHEQPTTVQWPMGDSVPVLTREIKSSDIDVVRVGALAVWFDRGGEQRFNPRAAWLTTSHKPRPIRGACVITGADIDDHGNPEGLSWSWVGIAQTMFAHMPDPFEIAVTFGVRLP